MTLENPQVTEILKLQHLGTDDFAVVADTIQRHEQSIIEIDNKINELNRQITLLRVNKQEHIKRITHCRGIVSLARRLPPEIVADIIEYCTALGWWRAPLVLSRVCSAYFQASRLSRVWSNIYIDFDDSESYARTKHWLHMSQTSPLDVRIRTTLDATIANRLIPLLVTHVERWRSLALETSAIEEVDMILSKCPHITSRLEELNIVTQGPSIGATNLIRLDTAFRGSVRLRTLHVTCNTLDPVITLPLGLENLHITLNAIVLDPITVIRDLSRLINIISTSLKMLSISVTVLQHVDFPSRQALSQAPLIEAPSLRKMSLRVPANFNGILDRLRASDLRSLHMRASGEPSSDPHQQTGDALVELVSNWSTQLRLLDLYDIDVPDASFAICFKETTELEELRLHWSEVSSAVFQHLLAEQLCPRLTRLDLRWCSQLKGRVLVDIVRQRAHAANQMLPIARIGDVTVLNCPFVEENDILSLAEITICRLTLRPYDDICKSRGCCSNSRYRQRFYLRHYGKLVNKKIIL